MINAVSSGKSVLAPNLIHVKNGNGKMSVPVQPYIARYVQFRHIVGIPAREGTSNVSVSKLIALDNLIDKFISKRAESGTAISGASTTASIKNIGQKADQIISSLEDQYINHLIAGQINYSGAGTGKGIYLDTWA